MSAARGERPRVPLDDDELEAILHDRPLPPQIAVRRPQLLSRTPSLRKTDTSTSEMFERPVGAPDDALQQAGEMECTLDSRVGRPMGREEKENHFVLKRYQKQLRAVSFAGLSYPHEVSYDDDMTELSPLIRMNKFLAVGESSFRSGRRSGGSKAGAPAGGARLKMWIPHTVVYKDAEMPTWIWSNAQGEVCKSTNFTEKHVLETLGDFSKDTEPVVVLKKPQWKQPEGNELTLLNTNDLCSMLQRTSSGGTACVQQLLRPKGLKVSFTRCLWRASSAALAWQITNRSFSDDLSLEPRSRLCVNTEEIDSCTIFAQRGSAIAEYAELCQRLVRFLSRVLQPAPQFSELAADFVKDESGRIWLLQVKAFRLLDSGVPRPLGSSACQPRAEYKRLTKCFSCLVPYRIEQLRFEMTAQMVISTEHHLRRRGQSCSWFGRPSFNNAPEASSLYQAHKVCQRCFAMYKAEQDLMALEVQFAKAIGVPVDKEAVALTGSDVRYPESAESALSKGLTPPPTVGMYRFFVFLNEIRELPSLSELNLELNTELYLEFTMFGLLTRIPLSVEGHGSRRRLVPVQKLRAFHFFLETPAALKPLLLNLHQLKVQLCVLKPYHQVVAVCALPTRLFRGQPVVKVDYAQLFGSSMQTTTLRATLGCVYHGEYDTTLLKLRYLHGAWLPEPDFYTCDSLPKEWIEMLEQLNRARALMSGQMSPARTRPPSAREYFSSKPISSPEGMAQAVEEEEQQPVGSSPLSTARSEPVSWNLKVHVDSLSECVSVPNDEWWIDYELFGKPVETFHAHSTSCTMPIVFNSTQTLRIRGSTEALQEYLEATNCLELWVHSQLSEPGIRRSVTIDLDQLLEQKTLVGLYDLLTLTGSSEKDATFQGEQLSVTVSLEKEEASSRQQRRLDTAAAVVDHVVAPGVEVIKDVGPLPNLDLRSVEDIVVPVGGRTTGPRMHGIGAGTLDKSNDTYALN